MDERADAPHVAFPDTGANLVQARTPPMLRVKAGTKLVPARTAAMFMDSTRIQKILCGHVKAGTNVQARTLPMFRVREGTACSLSLDDVPRRHEIYE